ncbi:palmitoyltransferase ZDHHC1 isoform X6 [Hippocampus zosterae]|uniref:palmitoyltransferase ZDHHC1 isoform X6 n=1 Tax=Hippocampus zosterae TaxID=109293 RepID=UPI00223CBAF5|nr:palmitoyltransferase ZDHHC1 isoform X6 [Hippocampus zosterae]
MDSCAKTRNRTAPTGGEDGGRRSGGSRTNGWSWPPHPFQMLAWLLYAYFAAVGLGVLVPLLPAHWTPAGYICTGVMFACHLCTHVMAVSVDPADRNVRAKSPGGPLPVFERSKRAHVIENCHCYLCQVDVGPKSKHCSACNKCVANFDHHCRWLNNCVGSRNYKLFLYSVASAALGACVLLAVSSYVLIAFFSEPAVDRSRAPNRTAAPFPFSPPAAAVPALAAVTGGLALLACVLLCHLLLFHFYLMWNRLSTYEYIVRQRHRQDGRRTTSREDVERATRPSVRLKEADDSTTLGYTEPEPNGGRAQSVANGSVRGVASPLLKRQAPTTISTQHNSAELYTEKMAATMAMTKKKKKKQTSRGAGATASDSGPDAGRLSERPGARLPGPTGRYRPHPPPSPVRAAAPPADYHSDSAESLEEVPVALDKLGSRAPRRTALASSPSRR